MKTMLQKNNIRKNVGLHPGAAATDGSAAATDADKLPQRKNLRAEFHDYSGGDYFVTICTRDKEHCFGRINDGEMTFSEIGKIADLYLRELHTHYSYVEVPQWVVMPNHVHAIITIRERTDAPGCIPMLFT